MSLSNGEVVLIDSHSLLDKLVKYLNIDGKNTSDNVENTSNHWENLDVDSMPVYDDSMGIMDENEQKEALEFWGTQLNSVDLLSNDDSLSGLLIEEDETDESNSENINEGLILDETNESILETDSKSGSNSDSEQTISSLTSEEMEELTDESTNEYADSIEIEEKFQRDLNKLVCDYNSLKKEINSFDFQTSDIVMRQVDNGLRTVLANSELKLQVDSRGKLYLNPRGTVSRIEFYGSMLHKDGIKLDENLSDTEKIAIINSKLNLTLNEFSAFLPVTRLEVATMLLNKGVLDGDAKISTDAFKYVDMENSNVAVRVSNEFYLNSNNTDDIEDSINKVLNGKEVLCLLDYVAVHLLVSTFNIKGRYLKPLGRLARLEFIVIYSQMFS